MEDSVFTRIIKGEIPCHKVYESDNTLAFLDIHPIVDGHMLVVPKKQVEFVWDLTDDDYRALMDVCKRLAVHARTVLQVPYVGERIVGTDVPHAHVHLLPFSSSEELKTEQDLSSQPDHEALAKLAASLAL